MNNITQGTVVGVFTPTGMRTAIIEWVVLSSPTAKYSGWLTSEADPTALSIPWSGNDDDIIDVVDGVRAALLTNSRDEWYVIVRREGEDGLLVAATDSGVYEERSVGRAVRRWGSLGAPIDDSEHFGEMVKDVEEALGL